MCRILVTFFWLLMVSFKINGQEKEDISSLSVVYKTTDSFSLKMEIKYPHKMKPNDIFPCIVFFYGGGWINGSIKQFMPEADYFVKRGFVCFLVDYRVQSRQGATPFQSLMDAKSAIRFVREHAKGFHIDPDSLIASGASAGGQLAAACALIDGYNDSSDNLRTSPKPNALILFNPVIDNGPGGYGFDRIGNSYKDFSPLYNIHNGAPPTIIFLGTKDHLIPVATMMYYKTVMTKVGSRCDLELYNGVGHGFFNKEGYMKATLMQAEHFLATLGYLKE